MMTISRQEFMLRARLDQATLTAWIAEEWLVPYSAAAEPEFTEVDVARAELIRDLKEDLDVNDAGIGVILSLVDQVHGLRRTLAELLQDMRERPGELRTRPRDALE
jgi:chaperone modulatory protein CbpM